MQGMLSSMSGRFARRLGVANLLALALVMFGATASNCYGSILAPNMAWDDSFSVLDAGAPVSTSRSDVGPSRDTDGRPSDNDERDAAWQLCGGPADGQMSSTSGTPLGGGGGPVALLPPIAELAPLLLCQRISPEAWLAPSGPSPSGLFHPPRVA
jgi:hypothetical protein